MELLYLVLGYLFLRRKPEQSAPSGHTSPRPPKPLSQDLWKNGNPSSPPPEMGIDSALGNKWSAAYAKFYGMWKAVDGLGTDEDTLFKIAKGLNEAERTYLKYRKAWWYWDADSASWVDTDRSLAWAIEDDLSGSDLTKMHKLIPAVKD